MGFWNTRGLRGSTLEELINLTNDAYKNKGLAIVQKIPTSITPVSIDKEKGLIDKAYFEKKSTVDYIGVVQGIPICFDAKETTRESLPLQNIHEHQLEFMEQFQKHKGISFLIIYFQKYQEHYFYPFEELRVCWENSKNGGRKSIPYKSFDKKYLVTSSNGFFIHYLIPLNKYLVRLKSQE